MKRVQIHAPELHIWQSDDCYTHISFTPWGKLNESSVYCGVSLEGGAELSWRFDEPMQYLRFTTAIGKNAVVIERKDFFSEENLCNYSSIVLEFSDNFICYRAGHAGVFFSQFTSDKKSKKKKK